MQWPLLNDGGLLLTVAPEVSGLVDRWVPKQRRSEAFGGSERSARIDVRSGPLAEQVAEEADICIEVLAVRAWAENRDRMRLRTGTGTLAGIVDLGRERADIQISADATGTELPRDVFAALTITAALLLGRQQKLLLHAGAFVAPNGTAWLLVGDSHSGKSTTCASLIKAGFAFLADDQVIISTASDAALEVEGWPRDFNLDVGFGNGRTTGIRQPADVAFLGNARWLRNAPLGGLIFPKINAEAPTVLQPFSEAAALRELIRQSPWLLADRLSAPATLRQMQAMCGLPKYRLQLGSDVYQDPARLLEVLRPAITK